MKPCAVFTIVRNEKDFLRLWTNYYCGVFGEENTFVLDNSSNDGSVEDMKARRPGVTVVPVPYEMEHNLTWLRGTVEAFQRELLREYEVVVFAEADEFLLTRDGSGLRELVEGFRNDASRTAVQAEGWNCVHQFRREPPLVLTEGESVLERRDSMWRLPLYDKTLISKVPLSWTNGFHRVTNVIPDGHPGLVLFHAWMIDLDKYAERRGRFAGPDVRGQFERRNAKGVPSTGEETPIPRAWKDLLVW